MTTQDDSNPNEWNTITVEVDGSEYVFEAKNKDIDAMLARMVRKLGEPVQTIL